MTFAPGRPTETGETLLVLQIALKTLVVKGFANRCFTAFQ
jgi:hypothetical protein